MSLFLDPGGRPGLPCLNGRPRTRDWDAADPDDDDSGDDDPGDDDLRDDGIFGMTRSVISESSFSTIRQNLAERPQHESRGRILVGPIPRFHATRYRMPIVKNAKPLGTWSSATNLGLPLHARLSAPLGGTSRNARAATFAKIKLNDRYPNLQVTKQRLDDVTTRQSIQLLALAIKKEPSARGQSSTDRRCQIAILWYATGPIGGLRYATPVGLKVAERCMPLDRNLQVWPATRCEPSYQIVCLCHRPRWGLRYRTPVGLKNRQGSTKVCELERNLQVWIGWNDFLPQQKHKDGSDCDPEFRLAI